jgi:hypothetical protein
LENKKTKKKFLLKEWSPKLDKKKLNEIKCKGQNWKKDKSRRW